MIPLYDMHCHLSHIANAHEVAGQASELGVTILDMAVTPASSLEAREVLEGASNVRIAYGLHPWWIADGSCGDDDVEQAAALCARGRFVGEVGLDFGGARRETAEKQRTALARILEACSNGPLERRVISLHAGRAAGDVLLQLERFDLVSNAHCIFHWFSGTSDELTRARQAGCLFSVNERMLASGRGREYARQIPLDKLLLETDAPRTFGQRSSGKALRNSLERTLARLAELHGVSRESLASRIAYTSQDLLG